MGFECLGSRGIKGKGKMVTFLAKTGNWEEAARSFRDEKENSSARSFMLLPTKYEGPEDLNMICSSASETSEISSCASDLEIVGDMESRHEDYGVA
jgi:hypothetical protein